MKLYKLTDGNGRTYNDTQWGEGMTHTASGEGYLCGPGWLHAYEHPLLAVLHCPIHADFKTPILWECTTTDKKPLRDGQMKIGVRDLTTVKRIELPVVTTEQRVKYAIYCTLEVYKEKSFVTWAEKWLSCEDRSKKAAEAAEAAARTAAGAAARTAAGAAWTAAGAAARTAAGAAWTAAGAAARTAAGAAWTAAGAAAWTARTARTAAWAAAGAAAWTAAGAAAWTAAGAAARTARTAAWAAAGAAGATKPLNLIALAKKAVK